MSVSVPVEDSEAQLFIDWESYKSSYCPPTVFRHVYICFISFTLYMESHNLNHQSFPQFLGITFSYLFRLLNF